MKGIGVSYGIAIGTAYIRRERRMHYPTQSSRSPEAERIRMQTALERFAETTRVAADSIRSRVGDMEAAILEGHSLMLNDPILQDEIDEMLKKGATAEHALSSVLESYVIVFTASEDDLTRQRAADVRDIKENLLAILLENRENLPTVPPEKSILVCDEMTPSMLAAFADSPPVGILTACGSVTSHAAILSKSMGIPAVFSLAEEDLNQISNQAELILDGASGEVILSPDRRCLHDYASRASDEKEAHAALKAFANRPTQSADGRTFRLFCNITTSAEAALVRAAGGEGIGLMRSEFLFMERNAPPDEEEQYKAYKTVAEAMEGRPVIIRTLDVGGDKAIPYLGIEREDNPFLGYRAIRYCLHHEALFRTQLRAILRAAPHGDVRVMLPFVISPSEIRATKALLAQCREELACQSIPLGMMIETPAAVLTAEILAREVDFFSIGTNDLTQYILTADRGNRATASLYHPFHPAVLRAIAYTVRAAKKANISVGICGEVAADPAMLPLLMAMGLDEFSISPAALLTCRAEIAQWSLPDAKKLLDRVMAVESVEEVNSLLQNSRKSL